MSEFPKKYLKLIGDFPTKAQSMSVEELKAELIKYEQAISSTEKDRDNDAKLTQVREELKELAADYNDVIKESYAAVKYIVFELDSRGAQ